MIGLVQKQNGTQVTVSEGSDGKPGLAPTFNPADLDARGYALLKNGLYNEASAVFETFLTQYPGDRRAYAGLAWTAERQWRWKDSIRYWSHCLNAAAQEGSVQATARMGHCFIEIGQLDRAEQLFTSIFDQIEGMVGLANIATLVGPPHVSGQRWDDCIARFPGQIEGILGKAALLISREAYSEADALLLGALAEWPTSIVAAELSAQCATSAKRWTIAQERWGNLISKHPDVATVWSGYARYLAASGDREAETAYFAMFDARPAALAESLLEYHLARDDYGARLLPILAESLGRELPYSRTTRFRCIRL